jgi:hypothetical protein
MSFSITQIYILLVCIVGLTAAIYFQPRRKHRIEIQNLAGKFESEKQQAVAIAEKDIEKQCQDKHSIEIRSLIDKFESEKQLAVAIAARDVEKQCQNDYEMRISNVRQENAVAIDVLNTKFQQQILDAKQQTLSADIYPFSDTVRESGVLTKTTDIEVGFQYQLMINGIPCLNPHRIVIETLKEKKLDAERIEQIKNQALKLAETYASAKFGGIPTTIRDIVKKMTFKEQK